MGEMGKQVYCKICGVYPIDVDDVCNYCKKQKMKDEVLKRERIQKYQTILKRNKILIIVILFLVIIAIVTIAPTTVWWMIMKMDNTEALMRLDIEIAYAENYSIQKLSYSDLLKLTDKAFETDCKKIENDILPLCYDVNGKIDYNLSKYILTKALFSDKINKIQINDVIFKYPQLINKIQKSKYSECITETNLIKNITTSNNISIDELRRFYFIGALIKSETIIELCRYILLAQITNDVKLDKINLKNIKYYISSFLVYDSKLTTIESELKNYLTAIETARDYDKEIEQINNERILSENEFKEEQLKIRRATSDSVETKVRGTIVSVNEMLPGTGSGLEVEFLTYSKIVKFVANDYKFNQLNRGDIITVYLSYHKELPYRPDGSILFFGELDSINEKWTEKNNHYKKIIDNCNNKIQNLIKEQNEAIPRMNQTKEIKKNELLNTISKFTQSQN